jgi:hypothetical protein
MERKPQEYTTRMDEQGRPMRQYDVPPSLQARIENDFVYHAPKPDQLARYERLRNIARDLAHEILLLTPVSREQSLSLTDLESAIFNANAAIARNE